MTNGKQKGKRETWKPVAGFEGLYEVSDLGRVRSLDRVVDYKRRSPMFIKGKHMQPSPDTKGYPQVCLSDGAPHTLKVHRLVATTFIGPRKKGMTVNHINGIKDDNSLTNLEYITRKENSLHAIKLGLYDPTSLGRRNEGVGKKLNAEKVVDIRSRVGAGEPRKLLAEEYGVHEMTVGEIVRREIWRTV